MLSFKTAKKLHASLMIEVVLEYDMTKE